MSLKPTTFSVLQVKTYSFPVVSVRANPNGKATANSAAEQQVACLPMSGVANHWSLELRLFLHSVDASAPFIYEIEIHAIGVVVVSEEVVQEKREAIAAVNGLGLLYSACREMILNITSRSVYGALSIPSLNFAKVLEDARQNLNIIPTSASAKKAK
jgi:hypothetical protein